jgi:hypothetical protein
MCFARHTRESGYRVPTCNIPQLDSRVRGNDSARRWLAAIALPRFNEHFEPVGDFPEVDLTLKQINTCLVSAFFGWIAPIL